MIRRILLIASPIIMLLVGAADQVRAQSLLSEEALFYRCMGKLAQLRPKQSDPLLTAVRSGTISALQACTQLLDSAKLTGSNNTKISDDASPVAKSILYTLHQLHRSWAYQQDLFTAYNIASPATTETWYEDSPMGSYVTRALFAPGVTVDSVLTGTEFLQPVRSNMNPTKAIRGIPGTTGTFRLGDNHPFAPTGELLGIRSVNVPPVSFFQPIPLTGFEIPDFTNIGVPPAASGAVQSINFPDVTAVKGPLTQTTGFAVRIGGSLVVPTTGTYTFFLTVNDLGMVYLDNTRVVSPRQASNSVVLTAGIHPLEVHFTQRVSSAALVLSWQGPGISKQVIPASAFRSLQANYHTHSLPPPLAITGNEGGGFIGNHNYLITTYHGPTVDFAPDGQEVTDRSWARSVINDTLCRDVPVVREADVLQWVIPSSEVPFRQGAACTACHATLDRQAGIIRGLRWNPISRAGNEYGITGLTTIAPSRPLDTTWSDVPVSDYALRPAYGRFFFRNYRGELTDEPIRSFAELAAAIRRQDDYYLCFAKRYYKYFTGIEAELGDPGDPSYPKLSESDEYHRLKVIDMGLRLKSHKSLRQLIVEIIGSKEFRFSNFDANHKGS